MDAIPALSQIKSFAQWATGKGKGAKKTQINFSKLCPVVSQITSCVQVCCGDQEGAKETQIEFLKGVNGMLDSVPVLGHAKGAVHYICGDNEGGHNAMKAASRTTGVIGGGVGGFFFGGPVGAAALGAAGGMAMDTIVTFCEVAINGENAKPYGIFDNILRIADDPEDGGNYVDLAGAILLDCATGYTAGNAIGKRIEYKSQKRSIAMAVGEEVATDIVDGGERMRKFRSVNKIKDTKPHNMTFTKDLVTGETFEGHNKQIRQSVNKKKPITNWKAELQKRVPDAKQVLKRSSIACSEQEAFGKAYANRPNASPDDFRTINIRFDKESQRFKTSKRCSNCIQYSSAMGNVPTDLIPEKPVPNRVRFREAAAGTALGVIVHASAQHNKTMHSE